MLALLGSGEYLPPMEAVDRQLLSRLGVPAKVVCLPTAAGTEGTARINYWSQLGVDHFQRLGAEVTAVPIIDAASANDPALVALLADANFIYLSGGKPAYLYQVLHQSLAWQRILDVHQKGGIVAGCSAGAMVMGERIMGFGGDSPAMGLLPGKAIIPHYDEIPQIAMRVGMLLRQSTLTVVGIDGDTVLWCEGGNFEVLGRGGVTFWDATGPTRYGAGASFRDAPSIPEA